MGEPTLLSHEESLRKEMNASLFLLCREMPYPLQNPSTIFILNYGRNKDHRVDYFSNYPYALISFLQDALESSPPHLRQDAVHAHALSLFLHSLDDHIHDADLAADHLLLHLRTTAWRNMEYAMQSLDESEEKLKIIDEKIDEYFSSIYNPTPPKNIQDFLILSRSQSATWQITPMLLASDHPTQTYVAQAVAAFMEIYRIQDDLEDLEKDILTGQQNSIYHSLTPPLQQLYLDIQHAPQSRQQNLIDDLNAEMKRLGVIKELLAYLHSSMELLITRSQNMNRLRFVEILQQTIPPHFGEF